MTAQTFFSNPFSSTDVISSRLYTFANDVLGRLQGNNPSNVFNAIIAKLTTDAKGVGDELGEVKSTLSVQVGKTITVNSVIKDFKTYMSENEPFIAKALGGRKSASYSEFYPQGIKEYSKVTKTNIEAVLKQVFDAADKNKVALTASTANELKAFTKTYKDSRTDQVGQKGIVSDNRADKTENRGKLEITLMLALHTVGTAFAGDEKRCCSYFNFSLLYAKGGGGSKNSEAKTQEKPVK